jgi:hypothetical protein
MKNIAIDIPDEVVDVRNGIEASVRKEVIARHERHQDLLSDQRRLYLENGRKIWKLNRRSGTSSSLS